MRNQISWPFWLVLVICELWWRDLSAARISEGLAREGIELTRMQIQMAATRYELVRRSECFGEAA